MLATFKSVYYASRNLRGAARLNRFLQNPRGKTKKLGKNRRRGGANRQGNDLPLIGGLILTEDNKLYIFGDPT